MQKTISLLEIMRPHNNNALNDIIITCMLLCHRLLIRFIFIWNNCWDEFIQAYSHLIAPKDAAHEESIVQTHCICQILVMGPRGTLYYRHQWLIFKLKIWTQNQSSGFAEWIVGQNEWHIVLENQTQEVAETLGATKKQKALFSFTWLFKSLVCTQ